MDPFIFNHFPQSGTSHSLHCCEQMGGIGATKILPFLDPLRPTPTSATAANKSKRSFRLFEQVLIGAEVLQESSGHQTRRVGTCEIQ